MPRQSAYLAIVTMSLLLVSCSMYLDGLVFNPCDAPATVRFSDASSPHAGDAGWHDEVVVPAVSSLRVPGVFADVGESTAFAQVSLDTRDAQLVRVRVTGEDPVPVLIPASFC
jgi:hypothetical protein